MIETKIIDFKTWDEFDKKINDLYPELILIQIAELKSYKFSVGYSAIVIFKR